MRRYVSLYYFLIVLLIMGAFASIAQNGYGLKILGFVSIAFGFSFLLQLLYVWGKNKTNRINVVIELCALIMLSFLLPLRLFYIHFPYMEMIFGATGIALVLVYIQRMIQRFQFMYVKNRLFAFVLMAFHLSLVFFFVAMIAISFLPQFATFTGGAAFILLMVFLAITLFKKRFLVEGESVSPLTAIAQYRDRSILLISLFFIFSLYMIFTGTGLLPKLYSDEFPQAYFELVNKAETGKDTTINGKFKHEVFKEGYDQFLEKTIQNDARSEKRP